VKFLKQILFWLSAPFRWIRVKIIQFLLRKRAKLQMGTLRHAIHDADDNKKETGRKNMVVFNTHSGHFEPMQKKLLKQVAKAGKNKSNKAMTDGRKKMMKKKPARVIDMERVKHIEEKSLYVTK
jgi:hypothetical protein